MLRFHRSVSFFVEGVVKLKILHIINQSFFTMLLELHTSRPIVILTMLIQVLRDDYEFGPNIDQNNFIIIIFLNDPIFNCKDN